MDWAHFYHYPFLPFFTFSSFPWRDGGRIVLGVGLVGRAGHVITSLQAVADLDKILTRF